jgi:hypothetical protein
MNFLLAYQKDLYPQCLTAGCKFLRLRVGPQTVAQMGVHRIYTSSGLRSVTPYVQIVLLYYLR